MLYLQWSCMRLLAVVIYGTEAQCRCAGFGLRFDTRLCPILSMAIWTHSLRLTLPLTSTRPPVFAPLLTEEERSSSLRIRMTGYRGRTPARLARDPPPASSEKLCSKQQGASSRSQDGPKLETGWGARAVLFTFGVRSADTARERYQSLSAGTG